MSGMKVGFNFRKAISNVSRVRETVANCHILSRLKPTIVGITEQLIRQQVLGAGSIAKALHITKLSILIPEMVRIPVGIFEMGSTVYWDEQPVRTIRMSAFKMGKYEVTNEEFRAFMKASGREISGKVADENFNRHPVVNVSWDDAAEYCEWLSKETGRKFRLPTEAEWEYAARGPGSFKYPWGNEFDPSKITFNAKGTTPVDAHPEGISPFGICDLIGNVSEWTGDWYADYDANDVVDPKGPEFTGKKVLRGYSWECESPGIMYSSSRSCDKPFRAVSLIGFRVAEDL